MKYAVCKRKDGEFECLRIYNLSVNDSYKVVVAKTISQISLDNRTRKAPAKITQIIDVVEHGKGFSPHDHLVWASERCKEAETATYPIYDFEYPEKGVAL